MVRRFVRRMLFQTIPDVSLVLDREAHDARPAHPVACSTARPSKQTHAEARGCDANKKIVGRRRHIAVDTDGRLLMLSLTTAAISDSAGAQAILDAERKRWPWLKHLFADASRRRSDPCIRARQACRGGSNAAALEPRGKATTTPDLGGQPLSSRLSARSGHARSSGGARLLLK